MKYYYLGAGTLAKAVGVCLNKAKRLYDILWADGALDHSVSDAIDSLLEELEKLYKLVGEEV